MVGAGLGSGHPEWADLGGLGAGGKPFREHLLIPKVFVEPLPCLPGDRDSLRPTSQRLRGEGTAGRKEEGRTGEAAGARRGWEEFSILGASNPDMKFSAAELLSLSEGSSFGKLCPTPWPAPPPPAPFTCSSGPSWGCTQVA